MADEIRCTILIERNGEALANMPIVRRYSIAEDAEFTISQAADNNTSTYHALQAATMPSLGIFLLQTDQAVNVKINANTPLPLNANGLILVLGTALVQSPANTNVQVNNPAAATAAIVTGVVAGT